MFKLIANPRLVTSSCLRFNSTTPGSLPNFDLLKLATKPIAGQTTRLNNTYLDSQANKKPYNTRTTNIISNTTFDEDPKILLRHLPRVGVGMGTSVEVRNGNVKSAMSQLARLLKIEGVRETRQKQRFHMKPSKVKGAEKTKKRKEWFHAGLKQLFKSVKQAKRRGY